MTSRLESDERGIPMKLIRKAALPSPCPIPGRAPRMACVGLVQTRWYESPELHREQLRDGVSICADLFI